MHSQSPAATALVACRLALALLGDAFLAFVMPLPLFAWFALDGPTWAPKVCDPPPGESEIGCEGPYLVVIFVVLPLLTVVTAVVYVSLSVWRGRTPMMVLLAVPGRRARAEAKSSGGHEMRPAEVHLALAGAAVAVVVSAATVWWIYDYVNDALEQPTISRQE